MPQVANAPIPSPPSLDELDELDDHRLVEAAAGRIGMPRRGFAPGLDSFVLHAPLELLARAALLPHVVPAGRARARRRIAVLADRYAGAGPSVGPPPPADFSDAPEAARALAAAVDAEDAVAIDAGAAWLGDRARPDQLVPLLAPVMLDRLSAAGHANIYLAQLVRNQPRGLPGQMLRHPAAALGEGSARRIRVPQVTVVDDADRGAELLEALATVEPVPPPSSFFIAPMVQHAEASGSFTSLLDPDGSFRAPVDVPFALQRFAAHAMLQGPGSQAPYGWTHCLTLAQAPLLLATAGADAGAATFVSAAYLAAHWATQGHGTVDLDFVPPPTATALDAALGDDPLLAASAAWHASDRTATFATLATAASGANDAHHVKYTLACLDAAATDPAATPLYLAAAAYLCAWWHHHPDADDPLGG
jgi:hypothetical protein